MAVILYVLSRNFNDAELLGYHDHLVPGKAKQGGEGDAPAGAGSEFRMKRLSRRKVGSSGAGGGALPLLDSFHAALEEGDSARVRFLDV